MKIAVVGTRGIPATFGGVEKHCEEIYPQIVEMGHQVTIYARKGYINQDIRNFNGVKIVPLWTFKSKYLEAPIHTFFALLHIAFSDVEVIHFHAQGPCIFAWLAKLLTPGKKLVFTCHGIDWQRDKWSLLAKIPIILGELCSTKFFDQHIMVSNALERYYRSKYKINSVTIANGTSLNRPKKALRISKNFGLNENDYILFVGRLVPEKAPHKLIEAFKQVNTDKKLVITGGSSSTDSYTSYLKEIAKDDPRIIFTSYLYGEELAEIYSNAYLYVSASELEGMPLVLLEAMSYKIPVLVSDIAPHKEIVGEFEQYGYMFKTGDVNKIKNKLEYVLNLSELVLLDKGLKGFDLIRKNYNWSIAAKKLEYAYKMIRS